MHLDTVLTMIDYDKFTIHPGIEATLNVFEISLGRDGELVYKDRSAPVEKVLAGTLGLDSVQVFRCAGGSYIDAERGAVERRDQYSGNRTGHGSDLQPQRSDQRASGEARNPRPADAVRRAVERQRRPEMYEHAVSEGRYYILTYRRKKQWK